jgi:hypothetical protein
MWRELLKNSLISYMLLNERKYFKQWSNEYRLNDQGSIPGIERDIPARR